MATRLPTLSEVSNQYPDCCLSLSTTLLAYLSTLFNETASQRPTTVLSIGSGTGLLETLVSHHLISLHNTDSPPIKIEGVEVYASPTVNKCLPPESVHVVHGTWVICPRAGDDDVRVWLFVYPRTVKLVQGYVERFVCDEKQENRAVRGEGGWVEVIVWAGPRSDMEDYEIVFSSLEGIGWKRDVRVGEQVGVREWEGVAVLSGP